MAHRWTPEAWTAWQRNNIMLSQRGFALAMNILKDGTIEHWATRGTQRIRNDPCWPLIETEQLTHQEQPS